MADILPRFDIPSDNSVIGMIRSTVSSATDLIGITGGASKPRYAAFISYSHRDEKLARWLHKAIETYKVPSTLVGKPGPHGIFPARIGPIFRDEDELPGAAELGPELESALANSAALIVICSPAAARSVWVDREIRSFKLGAGDRPVLAVIADGDPGGERECFPPALHLDVGPDGTLVPDAGLEPLAPDLRKLDRDVVKLKLIAGLLGVKYDDLYQRERRRARGRRAAWGSVSLVIMGVLLALSVAALTEARIALRERNAARVAQALAEHNADMAERRAWLAQTAAQEIRHQSDLLASAGCKK